MRDKIKSEVYFEMFIEEELQRVHNFSHKLQKGEVKSERILPVKAKIHDLKLGIFIAKYSKGEELQILQKDFSDLLVEWGSVFESEYYNKNLKMASLAILFNAKDSIVKEIGVMIEKSNNNDWLLNYILGISRECVGRCTDELLFPQSFYTLKQAACEKESVLYLKKYLTNDWYSEDCGCYEAHKSTQNIYYGYWSFEAGAVSKILGIEDESLKETPYYPYDLVHFKA